MAVTEFALYVTNAHFHGWTVYRWWPASLEGTPSSGPDPSSLSGSSRSLARKTEDLRARRSTARATAVVRSRVQVPELLNQNVAMAIFSSADNGRLTSSPIKSKANCGGPYPRAMHPENSRSQLIGQPCETLNVLQYRLSGSDRCLDPRPM